MLFGVMKTWAVAETMIAIIELCNDSETNDKAINSKQSTTEQQKVLLLIAFVAQDYEIKQ